MRKATVLNISTEGKCSVVARAYYSFSLLLWYIAQIRMKILN